MHARTLQMIDIPSNKVTIVSVIPSNKVAIVSVIPSKGSDCECDELV